MACKRIGFFLGNIGSKGGAERTFSIIANKLSESYDVMAISYYYSSTTAYHLDEKIRIECILDKNELQRERYILKPRYFKKIRQLVKGLDCAIMVSSASALGILPMIGIKELNIITWEQTSLANMMYMTFNRKLCQNISILFSNVFLCLTEENMKIANDRYSFLAPYIAYVYNPIDENLLSRNIICDVEQKKIITLARIDRVKGLEYLIEVANIVLSNFPDWEWNIYGQNDDKEYFVELHDKLDQYDISNRVNFFTPVEDIVPVLGKSSIYVMTSKFEGLPMSLLEAKALKLPIVAFDCKTGPSEIVQDGVNGDLITCYDVNEMAMKLQKLMNDVELRRNYSNHAHDNLDKFKMEKIISQWKILIDGN